MRRAGCSCFCKIRGFGSIPLVFSIFVAARFPHAALRLRDYLGALILLVGIAGEALADAQLKNFRSNSANKGEVCDVGLWRWSRHPNYFFEWFGWLAYPAAGRADAALAGRALSRLSVAHQRLLSAVSDPRRRLPRSRLDADLQYLPNDSPGIVLYLGLERRNSDDARHPQYRSTTKHHMGGMS